MHSQHLLSHMRETTRGSLLYQYDAEDTDGLPAVPPGPAPTPEVFCVQEVLEQAKVVTVACWSRGGKGLPEEEDHQLPVNLVFEAADFLALEDATRGLPAPGTCLRIDPPWIERLFPEPPVRLIFAPSACTPVWPPT